MNLSLDVGDKSMPIPVGVKAVTGMALLDLRNRRVHLRWLNRKDFKEISLAREEFRGMPTYYRVEKGAIHFWPAAAHAWRVVLTVDDRATQDQIDERNTAA